VSVAKVIEISARSPESFEAAIRDGIAKAGETVRDIQHAYVKSHQVVVENGVPAQYQVDLKITFLVG
jgi:hypothetical protein